MASDTERMREEIEATRAGLATDVDRLADRTSPRRIAERKLGRVSDAARSVRDTVMGAPSAAGDGISTAASKAGDGISTAASKTGELVSDTAQSVKDGVQQLPTATAAKTRGNPLAVGLIAFGAGLLASTLIPESDAERRAANRLTDNELVKKVTEPLTESTQQLKSELSETAKDAGQQVAGTAKQAVSTTVDKTKEAAGQSAA
jgi:gas vesicle protein